jgi:hypothetical protein
MKIVVQGEEEYKRPYGEEKILEIERGSTSSHSGELGLEEALKQERLRSE